MKTEKNGELKPVMVWIHGGGFISGSGNGESNLYGPNYILDRDIVLVTLNYRLGALGIKIRITFTVLYLLNFFAFYYYRLFYNRRR